MTKPITIRGTDQGSVQTDAGQTFPLGTRMHVDGGRIFRYSKAGSTAISTARVCQSSKQEETLKNLHVSELIEAGAQILTLQYNRNTDLELGALSEGIAFVNNGLGEGTIYHINSNHKFYTPEIPTNVNQLTGVLTIVLERNTAVIHDTTTRVTIIKNIYDGITQSDAPQSEVVVGSTPVAVAANQYFWLQTGGPAVVLQQDQLIKGLPVSASNTTRGAVKVTTVVIPTSTKEQLLTTQSGFGYKVTEITAVGAQAGPNTGARLSPISGEAIVPETSIGYALEPTDSGQYSLVYLTLDR